MAITPTERKTFDERLRETREESETRESETTRRKNEEIKRIEKRHQEEVRRLTEDFQKQVDSIQEGNRESMTDRDMRHRQDMNEMRDLYMGQLRKKMEEGSQLRRAQEETYRAELKKQKEVSSNQTNYTGEKQTSELRSRDERIGEIMREARQGMQSGIDKNREKLTEAHERELGYVREAGNEAVFRKEHDIRQMKRAYEDRLKAARREKANVEGTWNQKYYDTVQSLKEEYSEGLGSQGEVLREAVVHERDKYQGKLAEKQAALEAQNEVFRDSVNERQNTQVRSRDSKIKSLETKLNKEIINNDRRRGIEKENLTQAYEARFADLTRQKDEISDVLMNLTDQRVSEVLRKNEKISKDATRDNRSQMNMINTRNREERKNLIDQSQSRVEQVQGTADKRVRKIMNVAEENNRRMADYYDDSVDQLREGFSEKIVKQRDTNIEEQGRANQAMFQRFRGLENRYRARMEVTTETFENKIAIMKENHAKELKRVEQMYEQRLSDQKKNSKFDKDSVTQKFEAKLAVNKERHDEEIEKMNRKHEEDIRAAVSRNTNFSRKA